MTSSLSNNKPDSPAARASQVNSQVVKNDERARLLRLANTMITTNLAFVIDKSEDGQLSYKLDPCAELALLLSRCWRGS